MKRISKRNFLRAGGATLLGVAGASKAQDGKSDGSAQPDTRYDLIVVGGGNAGMPAAIFAAERGARVLIIEAGAALGGTLFLSSGQMSAAGTKLQKSKGIEDTPELFYDDLMRISKGTVKKDLAWLAAKNSGETFDWLMDNGFDVREGHPVTGTTHEPYSVARYAWGTEGGRSILAVLNQQIGPHIESGAVTPLLGTKASELLMDAGGSVVGVKTVGPAGERDYFGDNIALTVGGYASNPEMFERLEGIERTCACSYPSSQGTGIELGLQAGGYLTGGENHLPLFGAVLASKDFPSPMLGAHRPGPPDEPQWGIYVNSAGERFIAEDTPSHDAHEEALLKQEGECCWLVFDDAMFEVMDLKFRGFGRYDKQEIVDAFVNGRDFFYMADDIEGLARKAEVDVEGFKATVQRFNRGQASGDDELGRKHMPLPLQKAPYYAVKLHSWYLTTFAGLEVNEGLQVVRKDGTPIGNLFAAGEILGTGNLTGRSYCGGMLVTPALTFGRLLGQRILSFKA
jgi:fumarate reductase flavoprotein subunit